MSDQVIVFVADEKFLLHTKALAVNCRREGGFTGDFLWIVPDNTDPLVGVDLRARGACYLPVPDRGFLMKFNLFHIALKTWKQALFLDADCLVQRPLSLIFDQLDAANPWKWTMGPQGGTAWVNAESGVTVYQDESEQRPSVGTPILADKEEMPAFLSWRTWDADHEAHGLKVIQNPDTSLSPMLTEGSIYHRIAQRFPHVVSERMWNTSMVAWEPGSITDGTVERLRALQAEFGECNNPEKGGTDQQIIDLLLHNQIRLMPRKLICYFGLDCKPDEHQNSRVASVGRGWDGTEFPAIVHFARWYAPWNKKASNAEGYFNDRIGDGVVCFDFYHQNLADFETVFPKG